MNQKVTTFKNDRISPEINGIFYIKSVEGNHTFGMIGDRNGKK